jgi:hypothetical protein
MWETISKEAQSAVLEAIRTSYMSYPSGILTKDEVEVPEVSATLQISPQLWSLFYTKLGCFDHVRP